MAKGQNSSTPRYLGIRAVDISEGKIKTTIASTGAEKELTDEAELLTKEGSGFSVYDDGSEPYVKEITIPKATYHSSQTVPIKVEFSEPVEIEELEMVVNDDDDDPIDAQGEGHSRFAMFYYPIKTVDAETIVIESVSDLYDMFDNYTDEDTGGGSGSVGGESWDFEDEVTLVSARMQDAVEEVTAEFSASSNSVSISLDLVAEEAFQTKYTNYDLNPSGDKKLAPFKARITKVGSEDEPVVVDLYLKETGGKITSAEGDYQGLTLGLDETQYLVDIIAYDGENYTSSSIIMGKTDSFSVAPIVFVSSVSVVPEADEANYTLSLSGTYRPKLEVTFGEPQPTFTTGSWSSSNENIATIDANGQVALTNSALGKVYFTFKPDNGDYDNPNTGAFPQPDGTTLFIRDPEADSDYYYVVAGDSAALVIPDNASTILVRSGNGVNILWSSNAKFFAEDKEFKYRVELFEGYFADEEAIGSRTAVGSWEADSDQNSLLIEKEELTKISRPGRPAYTVRVSMPHPNYTGDKDERLSALAWIVVNPAPAGAKLTPLDSIYLTDDEEVTIEWSVENYVDSPVATETWLTITQIIGDSLDEDEGEVVYNQQLTGSGDSYAFDPADVAATDLKNTYMVTLKAKNYTDAGWSVDSYPLYVYNGDALALEIDGVKLGDSLTMDNEPEIDSYTADNQAQVNTETARLLALREELALIEYIGINYKDYSWSQLKDGIAWSASDNDVVSVNYKQGGLYENINRFGFDTYLPETKMALSSVRDGAATITATHANTGMSAAVDVDVKTLRDKFYLFQLTPMLETTLTYEDGQGKVKTVKTNEDGILALL